jgi:hypothetical protein
MGSSVNVDNFAFIRKFNFLVQIRINFRIRSQNRVCNL